jgi:hypothetical protein
VTDGELVTGLSGPPFEIECLQESCYTANVCFPTRLSTFSLKAVENIVNWWRYIFWHTVTHQD